MIIKPDAVKAGQVDDIIEQVSNTRTHTYTYTPTHTHTHTHTQLTSQGLEVLAKEERVLTKEEAAEFYKQHEGAVSQYHIHTCTRLLWAHFKCFTFVQDYFEELVEFMTRYRALFTVSSMHI